MAEVQSKDGTTIVFDPTGKGPLVIIIGGAMSTRGFIGAVQVADILAEQFTVIRFDRRGHGDSGDKPPYAVAREVEDIAALIEAVGGPAFLYGHSSGAVLALEAAASGLPIAKLALFEPPYVVSGGGKRPPVDAVSQLNARNEAGRPGDAVEYFMTQLMGIPLEFVTPMRSTPMWAEQEAVAHTIAYDVTLLDDWVVPARLADEVTVPALVLDGANSPVELRQAAKAVADTLPYARYHSIGGQSHDVAPSTIAPLVIDFFKS